MLKPKRVAKAPGPSRPPITPSTPGAGRRFDLVLLCAPQDPISTETVEIRARLITPKRLLSVTIVVHVNETKVIEEVLFLREKFSRTRSVSVQRAPSGFQPVDRRPATCDLRPATCESA